MAKLTDAVMFFEASMRGYTSEQVAALNFELMDVLGDLEPGSKGYLERAKAFHEEVARRRPV